LTVLVDSNVLIDVATDDPVWGPWSREALERVAGVEMLVVNPIVYAEVSVGFDRIEDVEAKFPAADFRRESLPYDAAFLAGKVFRAYRRRGGRSRAPLPDFYIGAHAAVCGYRLLTRDARRYRTCFPRLDITAPPGE
jgi:predicted nucleic acid-binding protein